MTYIHTGIPVSEKLDDMVFVEPFRVWVTAADKDPYQIELLYFEPDSRAPAAMQDQVHVAYMVDDMDKALEGKSILWDKMDCGNAYIAFVYDNDTVVEFMQMK